MKIYQYPDIVKTNQALDSFKRNKISVLDVKLFPSKNDNEGLEVLFFVLTDPKYKPKAKKEIEVAKKEVKVEKKEDKKKSGKKQK